MAISYTTSECDISKLKSAVQQAIKVLLDGNEPLLCYLIVEKNSGLLSSEIHHVVVVTESVAIKLNFYPETSNDFLETFIIFLSEVINIKIDTATDAYPCLEVEIHVSDRNGIKLPFGEKQTQNLYPVVAKLKHLIENAKFKKAG